MTQGSPEAYGALIQETVETDMPEFPALEAGFMVSGVITDKGSVMVAAGPPDFGVNEGGFFFFGQGRR